MPFIQLSETTFDRLRKWARHGVLIGESQLPEVYVSEQIYQRLAAFKNDPGEDWDTVTNRVIDEAER
jgi:hypothetical protein